MTQGNLGPLSKIPPVTLKSKWQWLRGGACRILPVFEMCSSICFPWNVQLLLFFVWSCSLMSASCSGCTWHWLFWIWRCIFVYSGPCGGVALSLHSDATCLRFAPYYLTAHACIQAPVSANDYDPNDYDPRLQALVLAYMLDKDRANSASEFIAFCMHYFLKPWTY